MTNLTIKEYLDVLKSDSPTPGGGSSLALVAANGIALLMMACNVTITKLGKKQLQCSALEQCVDKLRPLFDEAVELVDRDGKAFRAILDAMKMDKSSEELANVRNLALQAAYVDSAWVCVRLVEVAVAAVGLCGPAIELCDGFVVSDAIIGMEVLACAARCQRHNVEINANCVSDMQKREEILAITQALLEKLPK